MGQWGRDAVADSPFVDSYLGQGALAGLALLLLGNVAIALLGVTWLHFVGALILATPLLVGGWLLTVWVARQQRQAPLPA